MRWERPGRILVTGPVSTENGWPEPDTRNFHHLWPFSRVPLARDPHPHPPPPTSRCILGPPPRPFRSPSHLCSFVPFATRLSMNSVNQPIIDRPCAGPDASCAVCSVFTPRGILEPSQDKRRKEGRKCHPVDTEKITVPAAPGVLQACAEPPTRPEAGRWGVSIDPSFNWGN